MNFPLGKSRMHLQKTRFLEANIFIRQANYGGRSKFIYAEGVIPRRSASGVVD